MAEFLSDLLAYVPGGFASGFQNANQYRRQRALDEFQARMAQETLAIRKATEERLGRLEDERMQIAREDEKRQRVAASMKDFLQPTEALAKIPTAAPALANAYEAATQAVDAPETTPAGAGVLAEGAPGFGKDVLRGARDKAIGDAASQVREAEEAKRQEEHDFKRAMLDEQMRARREAAAAALMARRDMADAGAARKAEVLRPPEARELDQLGDVISLAESIKAAKSGVNTGPLAARLNRLAATFGVDDPKASAFYAAAKDQLSAWVRSVSGTAASDKEREFLASVTPSPTDADAVFVAKADRFLGKVREIRDRRLSTLAKQGRDVSPYTETDPGQPSAEAPPAESAGPTDEVTIVLGGKRKRLPRAVAEEAVKRLGAEIER